MARKAILAYPFEQLGGKLGTKQKLEYPENNGPAWDAPVDTVAYARNYRPTMVMGYRTKSGKQYFQIKTKSAVKVTAANKERQALLAVSSEIANILMADIAVLTTLQAQFMAYHPEGWSFKRWLMSSIREGLANKRAITFIGIGETATLFVKNPYISTTQPSSAHDISEYFPDHLLVKFWGQLANSPVEFTVGGSKAIAHNDDTFATIIESGYNVLGLSVAEGTGGDAGSVKFNVLYVGDEAGEHATVMAEDQIVANMKYVLTEEFISQG